MKSKNKNPRYDITVTPELKEMIEEEARIRKMSATNFIREAILTEITFHSFANPEYEEDRKILEKKDEKPKGKRKQFRGANV